VRARKAALPAAETEVVGVDFVEVSEVTVPF
jgi:hypothetical protein